MDGLPSGQRFGPLSDPAKWRRSSELGTSQAVISISRDLSTSMNDVLCLIIPFGLTGVEGVFTTGTTWRPMRAPLCPHLAEG